MMPGSVRVLRLALLLLVVGGCRRGPAGDDDADPSTERALDEREYALGSEIDRMVTALTLEDQAARRSELAAAGVGRTVSVVVDSGLADSAVPVPRIRRLVDSLWPERPDSSVRLVLSLYRPRAARRETNEWANHRGFGGTFVPSLVDGHTCLVSLSNRLPWLRAKGPALEWNMADALAPCVYLARFGPPGPAMAEWLARTNYLAVAVAPALSDHAMLRQLLRSRWDDDLLARTLSQLPIWARPLAVPVVMSPRGYLPPYYAGPAGVQCLAGRDSGCVTALGRRYREYERYPLEADQIDLTGVVPTRVRFEWFDNPLVASRWFATLLRYGTEEQFAAFWRGAGSLSEAYQAAYGAPLDQAIAAWARREWDAGGDRPPVRLGVSIEGGDVAALIGWGLLLIGLPLAAAAGRELGG